MKPDPVSDEKLEKVLEAGRWAPSWANTQTWRFVVVRENETKVKLAETLREGNPATEAIKTAPLTIAVCAEKNRAGVRGGEPVTDKEGYWFMYDSGLAMQNMVLMAHSLGLGTVIVGAFDAARAAKVLEVPEDYCVVAMTPLGVPAQEGRTPQRKELSEIVFNEKFGAV